MNIYCDTCKKEMEIKEDLGSEIRVFSCRCSELTALRTAARELVDKINQVCDTPEYRAVWELWHQHFGMYRGGQWVKEFDALAARLDGDDTPAP